MLMLFVTITSVLTKFIEGRALCILLFIKVLLFCSILSARPTMINSNSANVLVIDDFHPIFIQSLEKQGLKVDYQPDITRAQAESILPEYSVIAVRSKINFTKDLLSRLPKLRCIARGGAGMDNIDEAYALSKGIVLLNAPEGNRDAVAEHTIGMLISMSKRIPWSFNEVCELQWNRESNRGWEIGGKTIGLMGYGNTGSSVARKLSGFDCKIMAYDKYLSSFSSPYAEACSIETLLSISDVISFHVPLTHETRFMINKDLISRMKDQVVLINTSRGGIAKMADVAEGIKSGKIKSYATDVLENESLETYSDVEKANLSALIKGNQILITPHVAGWSVESYYKIAKVLSEKILSYTTKVKNNRMKVD